MRLPASSSPNAVNNSSACTTKRLQPTLAIGQHCSLNRWIQTALSNSKNAVSFSSACTTKRFPSSRCASTIQIVRPLQSCAETQPQLQPDLRDAGHGGLVGDIMAGSRVIRQSIEVAPATIAHRHPSVRLLRRR